MGDGYIERGNSDLNALAALSATAEDWQARARMLRRSIADALGLAPLPERSPLNPVRRAPRLVGDGADVYQIENVAIEILPGLLATGNLYRPVDKRSAAIPIALLPHGHDDRGRFHENQQHLAGTLARMGVLALTYDMQGYGEATQIDHQWPAMAALQTWQSMRWLDLLLAEPDVDPTRVLCTGYSGGGTQTFLLAALDHRLTMSIPVLMVSSAFHGGCVCESGLPIHRNRVDDQLCETNNAEIAALASIGASGPRPLLLVSADADWTAETPTREFPFVRRIYALFDGGDRLVANVHLPDKEHDYGPAKRQAVYDFVMRHWDLSAKTRGDGLVDEGPNRVLSRQALSVFAAEGGDRPTQDGTRIAQTYLHRSLPSGT